MKQLKIYLDTSVISHLDAPDTPDKETDTRELWEDIKTGLYEVYISGVTLMELSKCPEPKRSRLIACLKEISYIELPETLEVDTLARKYIETGILKQKSFDDCLHIAYACVYDCDVIVSWNFKHIVNAKTMMGVKGVNSIMGYKEMNIYTPTILISGGE